MVSINIVTDYSQIIYPVIGSTREHPLWWCDAHQWAINADNSGVCIRCNIHVNSYRELKHIGGCTPHLVKAFADWKQMI